MKRRFDIATGERCSGLWIKDALSECVRQKALLNSVCLLSADNSTVNKSPHDRREEQESEKHTDSQPNQMTVLTGGWWENSK